MSGGYNIYRGVGSADAINWDNPVAVAPAEETEALVAGQELAPGTSYFYALRAVSQEGLEESSRSAVACVEVDAQGQLLPPPLARCGELTARWQRDGTILLGVSHPVPPGYAAAEVLEIFSDGGTGQMNLDAPLATVANLAQSTADLEVAILPPALPIQLAVRARRGQRIGTLSAPITVTARQIRPAIVLPIG
jgi:hypothetical protein